MDGRLASTKLVCKLHELEGALESLQHDKAAALEKLQDAQQVPILDLRMLLYVQDHLGPAVELLSAKNTFAAQYRSLFASLVAHCTVEMLFM